MGLLRQKGAHTPPFPSLNSGSLLQCSGISVWSSRWFRPPSKDSTAVPIFFWVQKIYPQEEKKSSVTAGWTPRKKKSGGQGGARRVRKERRPPPNPRGGGGSPLRGFGGSRTRQELLSDGPWSLILRICDHKSPRICTAGLMRAEEFLFLSGLTW